MLDPKFLREARDTKCLIVLAHVNYRLTLHAVLHYLNTLLTLHYLLVLLLCSARAVHLSNCSRYDLKQRYYCFSLFNFDDPQPGLCLLEQC